MPLPEIKETHHLRYEYTEKERSEFSLDLARATGEIIDLENEKKSAMAAFADRKASVTAQMSLLARRIREGYEMRMVECRVDLDSPVRGTASVVRTDTGEVVKMRPMREDELQDVLDFEAEQAEGSTGDAALDAQANQL